MKQIQVLKLSTTYKPAPHTTAQTTITHIWIKNNTNELKSCTNKKPSVIFCHVYRIQKILQNLLISLIYPQERSVLNNQYDLAPDLQLIF